MGFGADRRDLAIAKAGQATAAAMGSQVTLYDLLPKPPPKPEQSPMDMLKAFQGIDKAWQPPSQH